MGLLTKLRSARQWRYLRLVDPILLRYEFCPVWANYLTPPSPVQVDTSVGTLTIQTGLVRSFAREYDVSTYSFPFSAEERVAFHPPPIFVAHYNEFSQIAARMQHAFVAVIPDARMGKSEWGEVEHEAFFFAPAQDSEEFEVQLDRIAGIRGASWSYGQRWSLSPRSSRSFPAGRSGGREKNWSKASGLQSD
jgi:hypothetical protein